MGHLDPRLGDRVKWCERRSRGLRHDKQGVVVYLGPPWDSDSPPHDESHWISPEERDAVCGLLGRQRFEHVSGIVVRVDRRDDRGTPLVSWYYAPDASDLELI